MESNYKSFKISLSSGIVASIFIPTMIVFLLFSSSIDFFELTSLSKLGESGSETAMVFNSSIITGGILLLVFAIGLKKNLSFVGKLGIGIFVFTAFSLIFVGVFNSPQSFHNLSAVFFFVTLPTSLLFMSQHIIKSSRDENHLKSLKKIGYGTLVSGIVMWSVNVLMIITFSIIHITIFELLIVLISSFWLLVFGRKLYGSFENMNFNDVGIK